MTSITDLLSKSSSGQSRETDRLFTLMYEDLCRLAGRFLQNEPLRHRLSSSSLVHQAYVRMVDQSRINWQGKTHFRAVAAIEMRRVLVDHARNRGAIKRGGKRARIALDENLLPTGQTGFDALDLKEALERLSALQPRQGQVVVLRFFGGLSVEEVAQFLGVSLQTAKNDWRFARAWLYHNLREKGDDDDSRRVR